MKSVKISLVAFFLFLLFIPMAYARGQAGRGERDAPEPPPPPPAHAPANKPRIDPSEPIRGTPATAIANDEDNRRNSEGLANVVPVRSGTVEAAGWQDPDNHDLHMGYRVKIDTGDGYSDSYGHLTPNSAPAVGTNVVANETIIGTMADPTNGNSTGPHVHVERRNETTGATVDPGTESPFLGPSEISSGYRDVDEGLRGGIQHPGVDHVPDWW
jgi:hypothetical protein